MREAKPGANKRGREEHKNECVSVSERKEPGDDVQCRLCGRIQPDAWLESTAQVGKVMSFRVRSELNRPQY